MKNNYRRSLGIPPSHLIKYSNYKFSRKVKDEELIALYFDKMKFSSFVDKYENKSFTINCINKLIRRF